MSQAILIFVSWFFIALMRSRPSRDHRINLKLKEYGGLHFTIAIAVFVYFGTDSDLKDNVKNMQFPLLPYTLLW